MWTLHIPFRREMRSREYQGIVLVARGTFSVPQKHSHTLKPVTWHTDQHYQIEARQSSEIHSAATFHPS